MAKPLIALGVAGTAYYLYENPDILDSLFGYNNTTTGLDRIAYNGQCPDGYIVNSDATFCIREDGGLCPEGYDINADGTECLLTNACGDNFILSADGTECLDESNPCGSNFKFVNGACEEDPEAPPPPPKTVTGSAIGDTFLYLAEGLLISTAIDKAGEKAAKAAEKKLAQEAARKAAKDAALKAANESAKKVAEASAKKASEAVSKDLAKKAARDAAAKAVRTKATQLAAQKLSARASAIAAKQTAKQIAMIAARKLAVKVATMVAKISALSSTGIGALLTPLSVIALSLSIGLVASGTSFEKDSPNDWTWNDLPEGGRVAIEAIPGLGDIISILSNFLAFKTGCPSGLIEQNSLCYEPPKPGFSCEAFLCYANASAYTTDCHEEIDYAKYAEQNGDVKEAAKNDPNFVRWHSEEVGPKEGRPIPKKQVCNGNGFNALSETFAHMTKKILTDTGTIPTDCPANMEHGEGSALCYKKPDWAYKVVAGTAWEGCKNGMTDTGVRCEHLVDVGIGRIPDKMGCDGGQRDDGTSCWEDYKAHGRLTSLSLVDDTNFYGCGCIKKTLMQRQHCPNGDMIDGLCYNKCPEKKERRCRKEQVPNISCKKEGYVEFVNRSGGGRQPVFKYRDVCGPDGTFKEGNEICEDVVVSKMNHVPGMPYLCSDSYTKRSEVLAPHGNICQNGKIDIAGLCYTDDAHMPKGYRRKTLGLLDQDCPGDKDEWKSYENFRPTQDAGVTCAKATYTRKPFPKFSIYGMRKVEPPPDPPDEPLPGLCSALPPLKEGEPTRLCRVQPTPDGYDITADGMQFIKKCKELFTYNFAQKTCEKVGSDGKIESYDNFDGIEDVEYDMA